LNLNQCTFWSFCLVSCYDQILTEYSNQNVHIYQGCWVLQSLKADHISFWIECTYLTRGIVRCNFILKLYAKSTYHTCQIQLYLAYRSCFINVHKPDILNRTFDEIAKLVNVTPATMSHIAFLKASSMFAYSLIPCLVIRNTYTHLSE